MPGIWLAPQARVINSLGQRPGIRAMPNEPARQPPGRFIQDRYIWDDFEPCAVESRFQRLFTIRSESRRGELA